MANSPNRLNRGSGHWRAPRRGRCAVLLLALLPGTVPAQEPAGKAPAREAPGGAPRAEARDYAAEYAQTPAARAVDRALVYLQSTQQPDGCWLSSIGKNTGITSLCIMAYLARGHEPGRGKYGENIDRAIAWVLQQSRDGMIIRDTSHGPMYSHGISTLMLGEALGMVDEERPEFQSLSRVYLDAVNLILRAQNVSKDAYSTGGWRYHPNSTDSDLSVTGWQLLALRAAQGNGMAVPRKNIDSAIEYIKRCNHPLGGFCYQPGGDPTAARTGTAILALEICGEQGSPEARRAADWLLKNGLRWNDPFFFYAVYYSAQGMYQVGGEPWRGWRERIESLLIPAQNGDGSWPFPPEETHERHAGPAYCTAMAALALSVDFKYLPIYQR